MQFRTRGPTGFRRSLEEKLFYNLEKHKFTRQTRMERNMVKVQDIQQRDLFSSTETPWIWCPHLYKKRLIILT